MDGKVDDANEKPLRCENGWLAIAEICKRSVYIIVIIIRT